MHQQVEAARTERRASASAVASTVVGEASAAQAESGGEGGKRYACNACPYATDRRDLFTRHENIHRDEKPFHCYLCQKQFNRADHVKKHFLRMHRDQPYDLNRIRRSSGKAATGGGGAALYCGGAAGGGAVASASKAAEAALPTLTPAPAPDCRAAPVKLERAPLGKTDSPAPAPHKPSATSPVRRKVRNVIVSRYNEP